MATRIWATSPTWTTRLLFEGRFPGLRLSAASRVSLNDPVDLEAAIDDYLVRLIVTAQIRISGWLLAAGRTPAEIPETLAATSGSLGMNTEDLALVVLHQADTGRSVPESIQLIEERVKTWSADIKTGAQLMDPVDDVVLDVDAPATRPVMASNPARRSRLGKRGEQLLTRC